MDCIRPRLWQTSLSSLTRTSTHSAVMSRPLNSSQCAHLLGILRILDLMGESTSMSYGYFLRDTRFKVDMC